MPLVAADFEGVPEAIMLTGLVSESSRSHTGAGLSVGIPISVYPPPLSCAQWCTPGQLDNDGCCHTHNPWALDIVRQCMHQHTLTTKHTEDAFLDIV
eukprot:9188644-Ditylum_brightwellii.AAC.1